ncbi:hypothetical protein MVEN_00278700 [Mycena venus]|uniref:Uncharacterized protein n=1 Tax=Mycena venus TaxID=2733690 RepID=A0A8H7DCM6_9AGAR|nr:hypothetical protein MVEN_00278700 [Mycena venus]
MLTPLLRVLLLATAALVAASATALEARLTCPSGECLFEDETCLSNGNSICGPLNDGTAGAALYFCSGGQFVQVGKCASGNCRNSSPVGTAQCT